MSAAEWFIAQMRICDPRVRIVRDGHEPNEAEEQRPCRVPVEPVHAIFLAERTSRPGRLSELRFALVKMVCLGRPHRNDAFSCDLEDLVPSHPIGCIIEKTGAVLHCIKCT